MTETVDLPNAAAPPGMRLYAIGDIHGCLDLLQTMHGLIGDDLARDPPADWRIIHLGDYVDRGADSAGVIDFLINATRDERVIALRGNHDQGFLDFLADPEEGGLFIEFGGIETARSYGLKPPAGSPWQLISCHGELLDAVPDTHLAFLRDLPHAISFGDFFFCHAGIRPGVPLDRQKPDDLIWIRRGFLDHQGPHPKIIVHGHTICEEAEFRPCRINVDTGACATGRLTAFVVDGSEKRCLVAAR